MGLVIHALELSSQIEGVGSLNAPITRNAGIFFRKKFHRLLFFAASNVRDSLQKSSTNLEIFFAMKRGCIRLDLRVVGAQKILPHSRRYAQNGKFHARPRTNFYDHRRAASHCRQLTLFHKDALLARQASGRHFLSQRQLLFAFSSRDFHSA